MLIHRSGAEARHRSQGCGQGRVITYLHSWIAIDVTENINMLVGEIPLVEGHREAKTFGEVLRRAQ